MADSGKTTTGTKAKLSLGGVVVVALAFVANHFFGIDLLGGKKAPPAEPTRTEAPASPAPQATPQSTPQATPRPAAAPSPAEAPAKAATKADPGPGFRSQRALEDHFEKHGAEFGSVTLAEYLAMAQALRDRELGSRVIEETRKDGVVCRFDRDSGAFLACNSDRTIRTFFKPNDGERYFRRQLDKEH